jgi:hypothetical protein
LCRRRLRLISNVRNKELASESPLRSLERGL